MHQSKADRPLTKIKVYLAGKIAKHGWRDALSWSSETASNPSIHKQVDRGNFIVTGPFFVSCDHGCYHGDNKHGLMNGCGPSDMTRRQVRWKCERWIAQSELFFAWINDRSCFGTLVEIGIAQSLRIPVYLAFADTQIADEMWFACQGQDTTHAIHADAVDGLNDALEWYKDTRHDRQ